MCILALLLLCITCTVELTGLNNSAMNAAIRSKQHTDPPTPASIGSPKTGRNLQDELVKIRQEIVELLRILKAL